MTSGIYQIKNIINNHIYIGSSKDVSKRIIVHRSSLNRNKHHSQYLQRAWNMYGEDKFEFLIIEECSQDSLISREQHYLDTFHPEYNISKNSTSCSHDSSVVEKIKKSLRDRFTKEERISRAKHANSFVKPESRKINIERLLLPENVKKARIGVKKFQSTPECKQILSESHMHYTDEIKKKLSDAQKLLWKNSEYRAKASKARQGKGRAVHSKEDVIEIRKLHFEDKLTAKEISKIYNSSYSTIRSILYDNWKWL
jgi:group I intron endonuclease